MKHLQIICGVLVLYIGAVWLFGPTRQTFPLPETAVETPADPSAPPPSAAEQSETRLTRERVVHLEAAAKRLEQVQAATRQMPASRREAQVGAYPAWKQVLATHHAAYVELMEQARKTPRGEVPCTLCDGLSYMPCAMCKDHDGKCVKCHGSGQDGRDVLCPTCLGSGKCYLCNGSHKMFCPFCDDGTIQVRRPPPSNFPPLN